MSSTKDEQADTPQKPRASSVEENEEIRNTEHRSKRARIESTTEDGEVHEPADEIERASSADSSKPATEETDAAPLPGEAPPLPAGQPPTGQEGEEEEDDDGWAPVWEATASAFYFYNRFTGASQWTNPRVPENPTPRAPGTEHRAESASLTDPPPPMLEAPPAGGYNPAIHGDYDPNAWYAQAPLSEETKAANDQGADPNGQYAATAAFNRFTGRFQNSEITPENFNDENKSKRQMNAFFDVDAAANSHDGRSLKAERSGKKLSKTELKTFKEKRKAKKEEKRRAWLKD